MMEMMNAGDGMYDWMDSFLDGSNPEMDLC